MNTVDEILDYAIDQEQQAADFYAALAQRAEKAGMKDVLMEFSREEQRHKERLLAVKEGERNLTPEQSVLRTVLESTARATGEAFFRTLVRDLAETLGVRFALVTRRARPAGTRLRTLAFWCGDRFGEDFEYDAVGTVCERVLRNEVCRIPAGLGERFSACEPLQERGA